MAVEQPDVGAFIAESMDRYYETANAPQPQWYVETMELIGKLSEEWLTENLVTEAIEDPDDPEYAQRQYSGYDDDDDDQRDPGEEDDEGDAADQWLKQHDSEAQKSPEPQQAAPQRSPEPRQAAPKGGGGGDPRRAYKSGWKAGKNAQQGEKPNPQEGGEYEADYVRGFEVGQAAHGASQHYQNALDAHAAGDHEGAKGHVAKAMDTAKPIAQHHYKDWVSSIRDSMGMSAADAEEHAGRVFSDAFMSRPTMPGGRPPMLDLIHKKTKDVEAGFDDDEHDDHPANFASQLGFMSRNLGKKEARGQVRKRSREAAVARAAHQDPDPTAARPSGEEGALTPDEQKAALQAKRAKRGGARMRAAKKGASTQLTPPEIASAKEEMARKAWTPEEFEAFVAEHGQHPLEHHDTVEAATAHAVKRTREKMLTDLQNAVGIRDGLIDPNSLTGDFTHNQKVRNFADQLHPITFPHPEKVGPDGQPIKIIIDPVQVMRAAISHPKGIFGRGALASALREQFPEYAGSKKHWSYKHYTKFERRMRRMLDLHPHYSKSHGLVPASWTASTQKSYRTGWGVGRHAGLRGPKEVAEAMLSVVADWLAENVQVPEGRMDLIIEEIYSKIEATYGVLFEDNEA
jgi:hypothetical protein